ncbi:MAG: lactate racemase domain-containing protein [Planctomycetaceae bacterium]
MPLTLNYGFTRSVTCDLDPRALVARHAGPAACENVAEATRAQLQGPLDFPPLKQACVPGDSVVVALDRHTPEGAEVLAEIWAVVSRRGIEPQSFHIIQPVALDGVPLPDPRRLFPEEVRRAVRWTIHDPTDSSRLAYLATTARGERVYLARDLTDADVVLSVGALGYDPLLGYRGTSSVFYPGLSNTEAFIRSRGEGHSELGPGDERPLRQSIDEIAWLLGTQFSVQVIPSAGTGVALVLAGSSDAVFRKGKKQLDKLWRVRLPERVAMVVVAIDTDTAGHGWDQLGAALATARNLVVKGGKIVVLSEVAEEPGEGLKLIQQSRSPRAALQPIRKQAPVEMIPATQLAGAADWAQIYLLSRLEQNLVDELFMEPLENEAQVARLIGNGEGCVVLESAQHTYGDVGPGGAAG